MYSVLGLFGHPKYMYSVLGLFGHPDTKLPQQASNVVAIYYVVFLSEIWQEFNMAFSIEGYKSSRLK